MAKKTNTNDDPATLAFSAVEDALKDSVFGSPSSSAADSASEPVSMPRSTNRAERSRVADKQASLSGSVANDDRMQGSRILYGLQSRNNTTPSFVATIVSVVWVVAILAIGLVRNGKDFGSPGFFASNDFIGLVAIALIPVLGFMAAMRHPLSS